MKLYLLILVFYILCPVYAFGDISPDSDSKKDIRNLTKPMIPKYQVQAGTLMSVKLITGIDTTADGDLIAITESDVYDTTTQKHLLIPKGSKLLGEYYTRIIPGQRQVLLIFNRIARPNGFSILLGKPLGVDVMSKTAVKGNADNNWAKIRSMATISTILGIGTSIDRDQNNNNQNQYPRSMERAISPTITLSPGHQFNVAVRKNMLITPYYKPKSH